MPGSNYRIGENRVSNKLVNAVKIEVDDCTYWANFGIEQPVITTECCLERWSSHLNIRVFRCIRPLPRSDVLIPISSYSSCSASVKFS